MTPPALLALSEPIVNAIVKVLEAEMPTQITAINAGVTDGILIDPIAQYLPYMPFAATLEGGLPLVAVQRLGSEFQDELQSSSTGKHDYAVIAACQNADHLTLSKQLERTLQAVANAIHADRIKPPTESIIRTEGEAWDVEFIRVEPGPLLGDLDPLNPGQPPASYLSWLGLVMSSKREEV